LSFGQLSRAQDAEKLFNLGTWASELFPQFRIELIPQAGIFERSEKCVQTVAIARFYDLREDGRQLGLQIDKPFRSERSIQLAGRDHSGLY